ncbi:peptidase M14 [Melaminivora sp.]|uniref:peptidase M14 n=1 Tax=Melaminivora sp. TaxID=1933032 RepID=UPI0028A931D2|nr:peptidase M14 [Melaminivora sp.]
MHDERTSPPAQVLLDLRIERTLDAWLQRFTQPRWRGCHLEGWLFEGRDARRAAEARLAAAGVQARLHSAYKPLVQYILDAGLDAAQVARAQVRYPTPAVGPARRFALEAYPLGAWLAEGALVLEPRADHEPWYDLELTLHDGRSHQARVHAPNRQHPDETGAPALSPTGWLRVGTQAGPADLLDCAVTTDYELLHQQALQAVREHPFGTAEPYFERLELRAELPGYEEPLPWAGETLSTVEALHEDLYFSLLEHFQFRSGRAPGDRRLQPGQIVPDVRLGATGPRLRVALLPLPATLPAGRDARAQAPTPLALLDATPTPEHIERILHGWPATQRFAAPTRQGRTVHGLYRAGAQHPVFISAGQHANETSGIVGALRAAGVLQSEPGAHFALIALENPDGYALHRELCAHHPGHMQHAARYTALGDDVEYRETVPLLEREARETALRLSGAQLHVNLHGYPAHDWTRPLSGYVPRGFEHWMLPKGFFLILRHHPGWEQPARALLLAVCAQLARVPGLAAFNARQRALYEFHAGALPFEVIDGIACMQAETTRDAPVTLITEFPDETLQGEAFRFAHTVQMQSTLAAVRAWQAIAPSLPVPRAG